MACRNTLFDRQIMSDVGQTVCAVSHVPQFFLRQPFWQEIRIKMQNL